MLNEYLQKLKPYQEKFEDIWASTSKIATELGTFEDKNFFSKVDVGIKVFKETKTLYGNLSHKKRHTPCMDIWYGGKMVSPVLAKIVKQIPWHHEKSVKEITDAEESFLVSIKQENDFKIASIINDKYPSHKYDMRLQGNEYNFYSYIGKWIVGSYGKLVILNLSDLDDNYGFSRCDRDINFDTKVINDLENNLKNYIDHKIGRNILLYGPPGTGKTSIAYSLGHRLGQTLVIKNLVTKLSDLCVQYINMIEPDVVIIDDIDRIANLEQLLSQLEEIKGAGRLVIATANKIHKLDSAILRPGRFDKLIKVDKAIPELVMSLVDNDPELFSLCENYTIATIVELMTRIKVEGKVEALANMGDLVDRDTRIKEEYDKL
jgi:hypothetical protein